MIYGSGTVFAGTGTVWENPTRGLPVLNPILTVCVSSSSDEGRVGMVLVVVYVVACRLLLLLLLLLRLVGMAGVG